MYRNIVYNNSKSSVTLFTWDEDGKRIKRTFKYVPYLYTETSNSKPDATSIFGNKLKKHKFKNQFERNHFIKTSGTSRIYNNLPIEQNFLIDMYSKVCKDDNFSQHPLSIAYIDIEVYSPDEFPDQWDVKHPINVISVYNSLYKEMRVFGLEKNFSPDMLSKENRERYEKMKESMTIRYTSYSTEKKLLGAFIDYWSEDHPDVVTGWNLMFDIIYIVNRFAKVLPINMLKKLSPVNQIRESYKKVYGKLIKDYNIVGITKLDYMDLYRKFNFDPVPNMKLDTIAEKELNIGKVQYESDNLAQLADDDWDLFAFYNMEDVNVIRLLEDKLAFIKVGRLISYMGLCPLTKCMDTLPIVNGYCAVNAYEEGKVIPTFNKDNVEWRRYEGAYVKEPVQKYCEQIVSYDLNSLYPMTMITLNTSPETKVGKVHDISNGKVTFEDSSGKYSQIDEVKFEKFMKQKKLAKSMTGVLFRQDKQGIFPKLAEEVYNKRLEYKAKIKETRKLIDKSDDEDEIAKLEYENTMNNVFQMSFKILINSLYGYSGNRYASMSDIDIAESITLTCQSVIKESSNILNDIIDKITNSDTNKDRVTYVDTDSNYLIIKDLCEYYNLDFYTEDGLVNPKVVKICDSLCNKLNERIKNWGISALNSQDCRFQFKMEMIADKGIFFEKKNYALHALNDEGFDIKDEDKRWKYKGIRLVSASMPKALKPMVKDILHDMILKNSKPSADAKYSEAYEKFKNLDYTELALVKSLNKFDEYVSKCHGWNVAPRMQAHYRGAYYHNILVKNLGIDNKINYITQGDKVNYLYLIPNNKYAINVISYNGIYPKEFEDMFEVDLNKMFEKGVKDVVNQFYSALGWNLKSPNKQTKIDVMEEFFG